MDQKFVEIIQKYNLPWKIGPNGISYYNTDFLALLADGKYYVNRIFHFSLPEYFAKEQIEELYQDLEKNYDVLPALPCILTSIRLTSLSPAAWCLYQNLLLDKFCWDLSIPQTILTQVWMHPGFAINGQINNHYFVPPTCGRKYAYSQKKQISTAFLDIFRKDLALFFDLFLFDLIPTAYIKELSYIVLNPILKDLVRSSLLKILNSISHSRLLNMKPFVRPLFEWVDVPDSKLLDVIIS